MSNPWQVLSDALAKYADPNFTEESKGAVARDALRQATSEIGSLMESQPQYDRGIIVGYRKTREGTWAVYGPEGSVAPGPVKVRTRAGRVRTEQVVSVSQADSRGYVYGYLAQDERNEA